VIIGDVVHSLSVECIEMASERDMYVGWTAAVAAMWSVMGSDDVIYDENVCKRMIFSSDSPQLQMRSSDWLLPELLSETHWSKALSYKTQQTVGYHFALVTLHSYFP
jgi:hypothetical protein